MAFQALGATGAHATQSHGVPKGCWQAGVPAQGRGGNVSRHGVERKLGGALASSGRSWVEICGHYRGV